MTRAFIAIPCPEELKTGILKIQGIVGTWGKMKVVEPDNIHMTLKFLGEVEDNKINDLIGALDSIQENRRFNISLRGVGAFPSPGYVRVLWVGVDEGSDRLGRIQREIDDKLSPHGFERDKKFHPHFTLARIRYIDKEKITRFLQDNSRLYFGEFTAREIHLMESRLSPKGPVYSIIHTIELP